MKILFLLFLLVISSLANEKVVLQLKWLHQFQFAGYYAAKEKGFYKELGLDVEIRERDVNKDNIKQVIDGEVNYSIADSILFLYKAKQNPVVIVSPILQHSPNVILTLKSSGIDSPYKLQNKDVIFYKKDTDGFGILSMFQGLGIKPDFNRIKHKKNHTSLMKKETDAYVAYITNEPFYFKENGIDINIINPSNYGLDLYGDMLFTNANEAKSHPERVERFKQASIKGWEYALSHKEEIVQLIKSKYAKDKSLAHLRYEANALEDMIQPNSIPIGTLDKGRIEYILSLYKKYNLIDNDVNIDNYIFKPFNKKIILTQEEEKWIENNPNIKLVGVMHQKPILFLNQDSKNDGILVDYLAELSQIIGLEIELSPVEKNKSIHLSAKEDGNYGLSVALKTPQNNLEYDITNPILSTNLLIFSNLKNKLATNKTFPIGIAINKEHKLLHSILNKAISSLTTEQKQKILNKWTKEKKSEVSAIFSKKEKEYLNKKKTITMCIDPDWMPLEKNENGKHIGMSADYINILEEKINIPINMINTKTWGESLQLGKERKCDIFSLVMPTKERSQYLDFTKAYLKIPLVIVTGIDELFINDISKVTDKKIGIVKGYAYREILRIKYPKMKLTEVLNLDDGLQKVRNNELYGFIGTLATTGYNIQKSYIGELKIAGKFDEKWELGVGVRNDEPILKDIFNKAIDRIDKDKEQEILNKWISVNYEKGTNYKAIISWIGTIIVIFSFILFIVVRVNRKLNREITIRKQTEKKLQKISITDELTTLYNRRHFNEVFPKLINSAKREDKYISFSIMDIDNFKLYNDTYGHISGDEALKSISQCIMQSLGRADDYCFRLGGEEFGILFKGLDKLQSKALIEKIRKNIEDLHIEHKTSTVSKYVTSSFGLVTKEAKLIDTGDELYKEADNLLYQAKNTHRNHVCSN